MVTSFSARLVGLSQQCRPLRADDGKKQQHIADSHISASSGAEQDERAADVSHKRRYSRRQQHEEFLQKQRRWEREQQALRQCEQTLETIQSSTNGMEMAKVITSSDFDCLNGVTECDVEEHQYPQKEQNEQDSERANVNVSKPTNGDVPDGDVSTMHMMANLVKLTRHYYDILPDTSVTNNNISSGNCESNENTLSETNSEGMSSWAPTYRSVELDCKNQKDIDNDNRSDDLSSGYDDDDDDDGDGDTDNETQLLKGEEDVALRVVG